MQRPEPGQTVKDLGCYLAQKMREADPEGNPGLYGVVVAVFPWGLRLCREGDPTDEWDCTRWEVVDPMETP